MGEAKSAKHYLFQEEKRRKGEEEGIMRIWVRNGERGVSVMKEEEEEDGEEKEKKEKREEEEELKRKVCEEEKMKKKEEEEKEKEEKKLEEKKKEEEEQQKQEEDQKKEEEKKKKEEQQKQMKEGEKEEIEWGETEMEISPELRMVTEVEEEEVDEMEGEDGREVDEGKDADGKVKFVWKEDGYFGREEVVSLREGKINVEDVWMEAEIKGVILGEVFGSRMSVVEGDLCYLELKEEVIKMVEMAKKREDVWEVLENIEKKMKVFRGEMVVKVIKRLEVMVEEGMTFHGRGHGCYKGLKHVNKRYIDFYIYEYSNFKKTFYGKDISIGVVAKHLFLAERLFRVHRRFL